MYLLPCYTFLTVTILTLCTQSHGYQLTLLKAKSAKFGLFLKLFATTEIWFGYLPIIWPFLNVEENSIFK